MRDHTPRHSLVSTESVDSRPSLDYLQPSPVRGQLEPYKEKTRAGWRFIQCTDTPDELKVLLPPRTAQIYSQLLAAETEELARERDASWERILQIRRLKERMIRKCGRLARAWGASKPGIGTMFRTVYAPADFRLKEMEKWIRYQETGGPISIKSTHTVDTPLSRRSSTNSVHRRNSFCCDRCASTTQPHVDHRTSTLRRESSITHSNRGWIDTGLKSKRSLSNIPRRSSTSSIQSIRIENGGQTYSTYQAAGTERRNQYIHDVFEPYTDKGSGRLPTRRRSAVFSTEEALSAESPRVLSPDPLPHPYRPRHSEPVLTGGKYDSSDTTDDELHSTDQTTPPAEGSLAHPPLVHRRSSLKQSTGSLRASMDATKSVAWAMDHDWQEQMKKYEEAAVDAEAADRDWETTRATYEKEMAGIRTMRQNVSRTLVRLRSETERLEKEDEVMKQQEYKLNESYKQLEQSQLEYRTKVQTVLEETKRVLSMADSKRSA